jgi:predicted DNA-binding transcriptional regulator AlpA
MGTLSPSRRARRASQHAAVPENLAPDALLRLPQIIGGNGTAGLVPMGKTRLYALIKSRDFPAPMKIGASSFWRYQDVLAFIQRIGG